QLTTAASTDETMADDAAAANAIQMDGFFISFSSPSDSDESRLDKQQTIPVVRPRDHQALFASCRVV
ncbi:MAG: hypothetical protein ACK5TE_11350, partial [Pseudomonadota bacterium]